MHDLVTNLTQLRAAIADTAVSVGRNPSDIKLIAVSKTHSIDSIETAYRSEQRVFGESTMQEALKKIAHFGGHGIEWHFLGHLQSNKAKFLAGNFSWIHSLDSLRLAQRLSRLMQEQNTNINALIEINVTGDPKKHGIAPTEVYVLLDQLLREPLSGVVLRGLMTIGPHAANEAQLRETFATLRQLRDDCVSRFGLREFTELSMGMSGDYVEAIKEGSTMLRIGTALFGERDYGETD